MIAVWKEADKGLEDKKMVNRASKITREQYKKVKRMDHKTMEDFVTNIYTEGFKDGKKAAGNKIKAADIEKALIEIKGIGAKKVTEIMSTINKLYEPDVEEQEATV